MSRQQSHFGCLASLFWLLITFGITAVLLATHPSEPIVRSIGGFFQFLGIVIVAWGIRDLRIEFKVPTWRAALRAEVAPLFANVRANWHRWTHPRADARTAVSAGHLNIGARGIAKATGRVLAKKLPPDRLSMVIAEVESLKAELQAANEEVARHRETIASDLAAEAARRAEVKAELTEMIESLAVGGLRLETVGVCWLFAGTVLTTWPCEIARWLGARC